MAQASGRPAEFGPAQIAEGWTLERLTRPSRLNGANGIRTGADGRIYVAQVGGSRVSSIDPDSGAIEAFTPIGAIVGPDDLVFDEAGNLYATELTLGRVTMRAKNGTVKIIHGDVPVANPITYHQGRLIAGELRMGGRIMELNRDGGAPRVIADGLPMVNAFDVGPDGMLYFPAQAANQIWRVSLEGGAPEVVAGDLGVPDSVKFHPDGSIISTQVYSGQVLKIDPHTGARTVLADIGPGLDNCTFIGERIFVSHITGSIHEILAPGKVRALVETGLQWPLGLALADDGSLFIADGGFTYLMAPGGVPKLIGSLFTPGFPGWVRDVVAAGPGEFIVTTANGTVNRWRPAATENDLISSGHGILMGLALAPGGAVIVADSQNGQVLSLANGEAEALASGLSMPMGVAVDGSGTVYVAEAGAGRVLKLSGGRTETLADGFGDPQGLAIAGSNLYVIDVKAKELSEIPLGGGTRRVVASSLPVGAPPGVIPIKLGGVGDMCGPMHTFTGVTAGSQGTILVAGDGEGSVLALRPA